MGKLVRDRIPDIIRASGAEPSIRVLRIDEYLPALLSKLVEEANEAHSADVDQLLEELADVYEVLRAALAARGWTITELTDAAERKAAERGGFAHRYWLD